MKRITITGLLAICFVSSALAQESGRVLCQFDQECFETEGCQASDFALSLEEETFENGASEVMMTTVFASFDVNYLLMSSSGALRAIIEDDDQEALYMLRSEAEGARLTLHMSGPTTVTYLGTCEGSL